MHSPFFIKLNLRRAANQGESNMKNLTCGSFFAGVGGIDLAFEQQGFKVVYANEIDKLACQTYEANFDVKIDNRDINYVKSSEIPNFDIMLAGFPCQAFSLAGYRQGFEDEKGRGTLFFELERIFKEKKPSIIFLENVKNLVGHDKGNTFRIILEKLEKAEYHVKYQVLNAMEYGNIPQNRERIYIVAFRDEKRYQEFTFPRPCELKTRLNDVINYEKKVESRYYYTEKCPFYNKLQESIKSKETIYQWRRIYVRENKNNVCPTLTANMGTGGHNVPLIFTDHGIRKLTPKECFKLQGYPEDYILPSYIANTHLYKQAGNSVVVPIISRIANEIRNTISK